MKRIYILIMFVVLFSSALGLGIVANVDTPLAALSGNYLSNDYPTIIIDAGHGGEDGGASSKTGVLEKDVNLDICLTLQKLLEQGGFNTEMIRESDVSIHDESAATTRERKVSDIHNRVKVANSKNSNILISVHQNHFTESKYFGTQVFYSKNNANSQNLAENIRVAVTSLLQPENQRKCKPSSNVYLLDNVNIPAVIVECGFLSNPYEADLLSHEDYRDNMAYSIYLGIVEFIYLNY